MTSAQASHAADDQYAYRNRLFTLVGDRNPLDVMTRTPSALADIVRAHSTKMLRSRPFHGKWTPNEITGHLVDAEWVYGYRLRLVLCEDNPLVLSTNQDLWVAALQHNNREPAELVETFATMRRLNVVLCQSIPSAGLLRTGRHSERGPESVDVMLRMVAGHDLLHLDQIDRYLRNIDPASGS